jgi:hypothetical protein
MKTIIIAAAVLALASPALAAAAWNAKTSHGEYVAGDEAVIAAILLGAFGLLVGIGEIIAAIRIG